MQVIQAFSKRASETLRIDKDFGTLLRGKAADPLVLGRTPPVIEAVYPGGRKFE